MAVQLKENEDYTLIPDDDDAWAVRIINGPFVETVIKFNTVKLDGKNGELRFNFDIISSPDSELDKENTEFQQYVVNILYDILLNSVEDGGINFKEEIQEFE